MILNSNREEEGSEVVQTSPGSYQLPANVHLLTLAIIPETEQVRILNLMKIYLFLQELNGIVGNCYICLLNRSIKSRYYEKPTKSKYFFIFCGLLTIHICSLYVDLLNKFNRLEKQKYLVIGRKLNLTVFVLVAGKIGALFSSR